MVVIDGYIVAPGAFDVAEVQTLRAGVENAVARAVALAEAAGPEGITVNGPGHRFPEHRLQTIPGNPDTSIHWESARSRPTVRNLRPVTHLDPRLDARWADPRLTGPAAQLLGVAEVAPLTSKISLKRARVGSEFTWHQDYTFLHRFLGPTADEAVVAMVLLDDADAGNGALTLLPGSHRGGPRPDDEPPRPGDADPVTIDAQAGTVVFFPTLMVHRSDPNRSERDRRALFYLYQPACRPHLDERQPYALADHAHCG